MSCQKLELRTLSEHLRYYQFNEVSFQSFNFYIPFYSNNVFGSWVISFVYLRFGFYFNLASSAYVMRLFQFRYILVIGIFISRKNFSFTILCCDIWFDIFWGPIRSRFLDMISRLHWRGNSECLLYGWLCVFLCFIFVVVITRAWLESHFLK